MMILKFFSFALSAIVYCSDYELWDEHPHCKSVHKPIEYERMYTVVMDTIEDMNLVKIFGQPDATSRDLIWAAKRHLNGTHEHSYETAAAVLSPLIFKTSVDQFVKENFTLHYRKKLKKYLLFIKYKFYCRVSHRKKKQLFGDPELWEEYKRWKNWYLKLYRSFTEKHQNLKPEETHAYKLVKKFLRRIL
jgi:hypothetical protein